LKRFFSTRLKGFCQREYGYPRTTVCTDGCPVLYRSLKQLESDFDSGFVEYLLAEVNVPER